MVAYAYDRGRGKRHRIEARLALMPDSSEAEVRRLRGVDPGLVNKALVLDDDLVRAVIEQVGATYGEIFERNLGGAARRCTSTGRHAPWTNGGLR